MVSGKRLGAQQMLGLVSLVLGLGGIQGVGAKGTENTKAAIPDFVKKHGMWKSALSIPLSELCHNHFSIYSSSGLDS